MLTKMLSERMSLVQGSVRRFFNSLRYNKHLFRDFFERMKPLDEEWSPERVVIVALSVVFVALSCGYMFHYFDISPATPEDFNELYNRLEAVQGNQDEFFKQNGTITIKDDLIYLQIENEQCKMTGTYNRELNKVGSYQQEDKRKSVLDVVLTLIMFALIVFLASFIVLYILVFVLELVSLLILKFIFSFSKAIPA